MKTILDKNERERLMNNKTIKNTYTQLTQASQKKSNKWESTIVEVL